MEIAGEKENMKKAYIEIGKLYYDTHKDDPEGFFIQLCDEVSLAQKNIADKEAEIEALKLTEDEPVADIEIDIEFEKVVAEDEAAAEPEAVEEVPAEEAQAAEPEKADEE